MKCKYCENEGDHQIGCPETLTGLSKTRAIKDFDAGGFSAAAYCALDEGRSDSFKLGHAMTSKNVLPHTPPTC